MQSTVTHSLTHAARVGADLFDRAQVDGLPLPVAMDAKVAWRLELGEHEAITFQFSGDDSYVGVHAWATWLGAKADRKMCELSDGTVEFLDAYAEVDGVRIRITANRR